MGKFFSYIMNWVLYVAPMLVGLCVVKGAPVLYALPIIGAVAVVAAFSFLVLSACRRNGSDLCRKLTKPL